LGHVSAQVALDDAADVVLSKDLRIDCHSLWLLVADQVRPSVTVRASAHSPPRAPASLRSSPRLSAAPRAQSRAAPHPPPRSAEQLSSTEPVRAPAAVCRVDPGTTCTTPHAGNTSTTGGKPARALPRAAPAPSPRPRAR